jgi:hypothetical protein
METVVLADMDRAQRIALLHVLNIKTDGTWLFDTTTNVQIVDRYTKKPVAFNHMMILPGSTIVLDDNPMSLILYSEEFGYDLDELVGVA